MKPARHRLRALSRINLLINALHKLIKHAGTKQYLNDEQIEYLHRADEALVTLSNELRREVRDG